MQPIHANHICPVPVYIPGQIQYAPYVFKDGPLSCDLLFNTGRRCRAFLALSEAEVVIHLLNMSEPAHNFNNFNNNNNSQRTLTLT